MGLGGEEDDEEDEDLGEEAERCCGGTHGTMPCF